MTQFPVKPSGELVVATLRALKVGGAVLIEGRNARQVRHYVQRADRCHDKFFSCTTLQIGARIRREE